MPAIIATAISTASTGIKTYRHEFSKDFMAELSHFSKVHQYDDRQTYKSEWQKWTSQAEIAEAMEVERRRLHENGYTGDIDDKMFKAGRYYFRKKTSTIVADQTITTVTTTDDNNIATDPPSPAAQRRTYITMSKKCIRLMDEHIQHAASTPATPAAVFKPSVCYDDFYQTQMATDAMTTEIGNIIEKYEKTPGAMSNQTADELTEEIMDKIKKTYKNRYYKYISSMRRSDGGSNGDEANGDEANGDEDNK
jgi:hypothetical protein